MVKRAVNHHVVPKVLQREFAIENDNRRIWRAKRCRNGRFSVVQKKRIDKTFVRRNYYTTLEGEQQSDRIERDFYGKIDDFLGRTLPEVLTILKEGAIPSFASVSLSSLRTVVMHMAKRTPDFLERPDDSEIGRELVEMTLNALPSSAPKEHRERLVSTLQDESKLRDRGRDIRVKATLKESEKVNDALLEFIPRWVVSRSHHSFILSSKMLYRIGNGGPNGLINPNMEMWMPISPKISLVLVRNEHNSIPHRVIAEPNSIRKFNEYAVRNSFEVASHSEALLRSLTSV